MRKVSLVAVGLILVSLASSQATYQPRYKGDPARSDSEFVALAYMRTFLRAQRIYKRKQDHYATSLMALTKTGSFTRRMASTDRENYIVKFHSHKEKDTFEIIMVPKQQDAEHRSFFSDEQGKIRADETKEADESSELLK